MTSEVQMYVYRKMFHLSYQEVMDEPAHEFFTNLRIYGLMQKKSQLEAKHGT